MKTKNLSATQKITISALMMAIYIVILYFTQGFSFGQFQVRIATAIYAVSYIFPFLILPLAAANCLSNLLFGGLGIFDIIGGFCVGLITTVLIVIIKKTKAPQWLIIFPIAIVPAFGVSIYLSMLLGIPYWTLVWSLLLGQAISGVVGYLLVKSLEKAL